MNSMSCNGRPSRNTIALPSPVQVCAEVQDWDLILGSFAEASLTALDSARLDLLRAAVPAAGQQPPAADIMAIAVYDALVRGTLSF